jgi:RNA polymerase sigma-70 factor (ECF subfamily)
MTAAQKGGRLYRNEVAISAAEREVLLLRAQTGDREALNALFDSCHKKLHRRALRILPKPQDAEDAVQEAMIAAFTHLKRFQGRADFLTWATRILINAALQQIRRARAKPTVSWEQVLGERDGTSCEEYLRDPQPTPEERLRGREQRQLLANALSKLPVESLQAIQLCQFAENPLKVAANKLGLPVTTLKTRLHRARRALAVHLKRKTQANRAKPFKQSLPRFATDGRSVRPRDISELFVAMDRQ